MHSNMHVTFISYVYTMSVHVAEWVKPLAAVHTGQGSLPAWAEACSLPRGC